MTHGWKKIEQKFSSVYKEIQDYATCPCLYQGVQIRGILIPYQVPLWDILTWWPYFKCTTRDYDSVGLRWAPATWVVWLCTSNWDHIKYRLDFWSFKKRAHLEICSINFLVITPWPLLKFLGSCWRFGYGPSLPEASKWYNVSAGDQFWRPWPPRTWWQGRTRWPWAWWTSKPWQQDWQGNF